MAHHPVYRGDRGFSLIELSIVMVIIGLILSIGITTMGPAIKAAADEKTRRILNDGVDSLKGYVAAHRFLPSGTDFSDSLVQFQQTVRNSSDGGNNNIRFVWDYDLQSNNPDSISSPICNRSATSLKIVNCSGTGIGIDGSLCTKGTFKSKIENVAFALISVGNNGFSQISDSKRACLTAEDDEDDENFCNGITTLQNHDYNDTEVSSQDPLPSSDPADKTTIHTFDDIIEYVTLDQLKAAAGCIGAPVQIITSSTLPSIVGATVAQCSSFSTEPECEAKSYCNWESPACVDGTDCASSNVRQISSQATQTLVATGGIQYLGNYLWCLNPVPITDTLFSAIRTPSTYTNTGSTSSLVIPTDSTCPVDKWGAGTTDDGALKITWNADSYLCTGTAIFEAHVTDGSVAAPTEAIKTFTFNVQ